MTPNYRFPVLGTTVPPMLGRKAAFAGVWNALTKEEPDHIQVVGARFSGKTVLLTELARRISSADGPYTAVFLWDLGHQTPDSDERFMQRFAAELAAALANRHRDYANHLKGLDDCKFSDVAEVLDLLKDEGGRVLAIMDGFDKPLSSGKLSRNVWDQLRELALKPSLRLVTGSRRTLRQLLSTPDAQTSDFWNIFAPAPVRIGCFDQNDMDSVLDKMPGGGLTDAARTEIWNMSNGFPVMTLEVLNALIESDATGTIGRDGVAAVGQHAYERLRDRIDVLWEDCPEACKQLLRDVRENGTVRRADVAAANADILIDRGFVSQRGDSLWRVSTLLCRYLDEQPKEVGALARLFTTPAAYEKQFRVVLEHRLAQIHGVDESLRDFIRNGIVHLPRNPEISLGVVRGILDRAFLLIWEAELPRKNGTLGQWTVPSQWMATWKNKGIHIDGLPDIPRGGKRLRLLDPMTGNGKTSPCARCVTRATYALMSSLQSMGDFGQHREGAPADVGTAYAAMHMCIELAATLARELSPRE